MEDTDINDVTLIKKNDPVFPDHLEFNFLKEQTLTHLGQLSGKVWTDHNVHDPGITILEVLIYALLDLGYRVQLPKKDLFATNPLSGESEDNFFTPNQILTNNPTTILDYRKLLMDIPGVRNAWLEVVEDLLPHEGASLFLKDGQLNCEGEGKPMPLNGLYRVHLQLDKEEPYCRNGQPQGVKDRVIKEAKKRLGAHRNLAEDFVSVNIYEEHEIGLEVDLVIEEGVDAEALYIEVLLLLEAFFSPRVQYYTLEKLLAKNRSIEEIYAGRPFTLESFGFIDTEELEKIEIPSVIYQSDIYQLLLNVDGVQSARNLRLTPSIGEMQGETESEQCPNLIYCLPPNHAPVFCVDRSSVRLFDQNAVVNIRGSRTRILLREKLSGKKRTLYKNGDQLDRDPISGNFRPDLPAYFSIQNDFPRVYQIGEGGLTPETSPPRKAQALQLKGYLLFFDQLLAGYLKQLSHLRDLFSLKPDSQRAVEARHTYFATDLSTVPGFEKLLRFHQQQERSEPYKKGAVLAIPISKKDYEEGILPALDEEPMIEIKPEPRRFAGALTRDTIVKQFQREFVQEDFEYEVHKDKEGYFFVLSTAFNDTLLISKRRYDALQEARIEASSIAYFGRKEGNYRPINHFVSQASTANTSDTNGEASYFSFELVFHPVDYVAELQDLVENKEHYLERRNTFLNHLLSRFALSFADFGLLAYKSLDETQPSKELVIAGKANILYNFDDLSRNRGRAFDYCHFSWNTTNVSGFEKQLAAFTGLPDFRRQHICNFEVVGDDEFSLLIRDYRDRALFSTQQTFSSPEEAKAAIPKLTSGLKNFENYRLGKTADAQYGFYVEHQGLLAFHPEVFPDPGQRDERLRIIASLFCNRKYEGNVFAAENAYQLQVASLGNGFVARSTSEHATEARAWKTFGTFVEQLNGSPDNTTSELSQQPLSLSQNPFDRSLLIDEVGLKSSFRLATAVFGWEVLDAKGTVLKLSQQSFSTPKEAAQALLKQANTTPWLTTFKRAYSWQILDKDKSLLLESELLYHNTKKAQQAWRESIDLGKSKENFEIRPTEKNSYIIELINAEGGVVARSEAKSKRLGEARIEKLRKVWGAKEYVKFSDNGQAFGYRLAEKKRTILESNFLFRDQAASLLQLQELLQIADQEEKYFLSGDEANLNFGFSIRNQSGQFIASHPKTYDTLEDRSAALEGCIAFCLKYLLPLQVREVFSFQVIDHNRGILLESLQTFRSEPAAEEAFLVLMHQIVEPANCRIVAIEEGARYQLQIYQDHEMLAQLPLDLPSRLAVETILQRIRLILRSAAYQASTASIPKRWKYLFWWQPARKEAEPLFVSAESFGSKAKATEAYQQVFNRMPELLIENIGTDEEGYGFQFKLPGEKAPVAIHDTRYANTTDRDEVKREAGQAASFVGDVQRLSGGDEEAGEQLVEKVRMNARQGTYSYRILKRDQPLAFYPCQCYQDTEDDLENLKDKANALFGPPSFTEICLAGDIICKIEEKYHYQIKEVDEAGKVYFISFAGYDSIEEAKSAFDREYLLVIDLASDEDNYCTPQAPENANAGESCTGKISLVETYDSYVETCLDGGVPLVVIPSAITEANFDQGSIVETFKRFPIRLIEDRLGSQKSIDIVHKYYFRIWDGADCGEKWRSYRWYDEPGTAWRDFRLFVNLLENEVNYRSVFDLDGYLDCWSKDKMPNNEDLALGKCGSAAVGSPTTCCHYVAIAEVLATSIQTYDSEAAAWGLNPDGTINEESGLEEFLKFGHDRQYYHLTRTVDPKMRFSFVVVNDDYSLAKHPYTYHSEDELVDVRTQLENCPWPDVKKITIEGVLETDTGASSRYIYQYKPNGGDDSLWKSIHNYPNDGAAEQAGKEDIMEIMQYARERRFYIYLADGSGGFQLYLCKKAVYFESEAEGTQRDQDKREMLAWCQQNDLILATYSTDTPTVDRDEAINKRIDIAMTYPYIEREDGIAFQLYCSSFKTGVRDDLKRCEACTDKEPEVLTGGVIWESCQTFDSLAEAEVQFENFKTLYQNRPLIVSTGEENCKFYSLLFVDEEGIIAEHPQQYELKSDVEAAIERTIACVNTEGFHFVEHLLLRPGFSVKKDDNSSKLAPECFLEVNPAMNCCLPFAKEKEEILMVCPGEADEVGGEPTTDRGTLTEDTCEDQYIPGADPYSFWATLALPDWTARYREPGFRDGFQRLTQRLAPAHLALNIRWLSPKELYDFEDLYKLWLKSIQNSCETDRAKPNCPGEEVGCNFVDLLSDLTVFSPSRDGEALNQTSSGPMNLSGFSHQAMASLFSRRKDEDRLTLAMNQFRTTSNAHIWLDKLKVTDRPARPAPSEKPPQKEGSATQETRLEPGNTIEQLEHLQPEPTEPPPTSSTPEVSESALVVPEQILSTKEIRRRMRKRMAHYTKVVKAKADVNLRKSKMFERSLDFLGSSGQLDVLQGLVDYIIKHGLSRKGADVQRFQLLIENAVWFHLDNQVMDNATRAGGQKALKSLFAKLKKQGIDLSKIAAEWKGTELKTWMEAPAVDKYLKLMK